MRVRGRVVGAGFRATESAGDGSARLVETAHILRRLTFGPFPGAARRAIADHPTADAVVESMLAAPPIPFDPYIDLDGRREAIDIDLPGAVDSTDPAAEVQRIRRINSYRPWWVARMQSDEAAVHERMMWFWHTHFTTSFLKVDDTRLCWRQLRTLHRHALGNFGDLAKALVTDGAMLVYLDGSGSVAPSPNENFGRELMELFMLGIDHYTQADVVSAAYSLSGWKVANPTKVIEFDPLNGPTKPVELLGRTKRFDHEQVIDLLLSHEACAPFIVTKLWRYFIGGEPDAQLIGRWASGFRRSGYEIAPLLAAMLHSPAFMASTRRRAHSPIEWYCAAVRNADEVGRNCHADLAGLGQSPYLPPSVAGWPGDEAWLASSHLDSRVRLLSGFALPHGAVIGESADAVAAVIERCSLFGIGAADRSALTELDRSLRGDPGVAPATRGALLLSAAMMTPDGLLA